MIAPAKAPSPLGTLAALAQAEARAFLHSARTLIWTVGVPLLVLFLGESRIRKGTALAHATFAVSSTALMLGVFTLGLFGYATVLAVYRERGVFQRLRCAPVPPWQILGARLLVQMLAVLAQALILFAAAYLVYGVLPSAQGAGLALVATILAGLTALALGQAVVALVGTAGGVSGVARVLLIALLLLQGVFFGGQAWPGWLQTLGDWTPIRMGTKLLADALISRQWGGADMGYALGLVIWIAALAYLGFTRFCWEEE